MKEEDMRAGPRPQKDHSQVLKASDIVCGWCAEWECLRVYRLLCGACCWSWNISRVGGSCILFFFFTVLKFYFDKGMTSGIRRRSGFYFSSPQMTAFLGGALSWLETLWPTVWILWEFCHLIHLFFLTSLVLLVSDYFSPILGSRK